MKNVDYTGYLLAAHPLRQNFYLKQGVIFVVNNCKSSGSFGLQINQKFDSSLSLNVVMHQLGFLKTKIKGTIPLFYGGDQNPNKIYILHSDDWYSQSSVQFSSNVMLTSDLSILMALSQGQGPKQLRAIKGNCFWLKSQLEHEIQEHEWSYAESSQSLIFSFIQRSQWQNVLTTANHYQIDSWFV